jgi:N-carbamoyl-L-amino-acid hydrolase
MTRPSFDGRRLMARLGTLGEIGRDPLGRLARLAATDADKAGRDQLAAWLAEAGLEVMVDRMGDQFGLWRPPACADREPLMLGSHIDTVVNGGIYDGAYGVLAALEVVETLKAAGFTPARPILLAAFTNEEGARYAPDMMGSLVYAGGMTVEAALGAVGADGSVLGAELTRIGYAGALEPGFLKPHAYVELHIEQGPVLEREGLWIGVVETVQGISWRRVTIAGTANHAGTTPMSMRRDAGAAAAQVIAQLPALACATSPDAVATCGSVRFEPDVINVIPARASFTIDLRDPSEARLAAAEAALARLLDDAAEREGVTVDTEQLARFEPVTFDEAICRLIEQAAAGRHLGVRRMASGAGHDAQMIARLCPAAMIFVPSRGGISHSPREHTDEAHLVAGANVFLDVVAGLASEG